MQNEFVTRLRRDVEPTRTAVAMTEAVRRHIEDLLDDDPGDDDHEALMLIREGQRHIAELMRVLLALLRRRS